MEAKILRKIRESFGRCTLKKGFYEELLRNLQANSIDSTMSGVAVDAGQQRQFLKNDISFLLLAAGEQQSGKIALTRLATQKGKSMLNVPVDQFGNWIDALLTTVKTYDARFSPELESGWREVVESGLRQMAQHRK